MAEEKKKATESKSQRFKRLAVKRMDKVIKALRTLRQCSSRASYEFTENQVRQLRSTLVDEVRSTVEAYENALKGKEDTGGGFTFTE